MIQTEAAQTVVADMTQTHRSYRGAAGTAAPPARQLWRRPPAQPPIPISRWRWYPLPLRVSQPRSPTTTRPLERTR